MLPAISKILEKTVDEQVLNYIEQNNMLTKHLSGFRKPYNCEKAFQYLLSDWKDCNDKNLFTLILFLDFIRAFETIGIERLVEKLRKYGFCSTTLTCFKN